MKGSLNAINSNWLVVTWDLSVVRNSCRFRNMFGIPTFFAFIVSFFITCIPLLGTIAGFKGAIDVWGWSFFEAGALFFGPFIILIILSFLNSRNY